jgi:hypothetical protein
MPRKPGIATASRRAKSTPAESEEVPRTHSVDTDTLIAEVVRVILLGVDRLGQIDATLNALVDVLSLASQKKPETGPPAAVVAVPEQAESLPEPLPTPAVPLPAPKKVKKAEPVPESTPEPVKPSKPPTRDEVKEALLAFARSHGREKLVALLGKYGGTKLADVPETQLAALKAAAEG